jgi:serine protease Do
MFKARVVGTDAKTDIAVLKIDGSNFPTLTLANSDKLDVGDVVLAVGQPFGLGETVTQGIVSAKGRSGLGIEQVEDFIQTDAAINPGNSGGALVDQEGHLVGINTAIVGGQGGNVGIGFAVPINMAKHDMDEILSHGKVVRAYMGILPEDLSPALARSFHAKDLNGALVSEITPGAPASRSNLKQGDIIVEMNGQPVADANQLRLKVGNLSPNSNVTFKVMRDGQPMTVTMQLGDTPSDEARLNTSRGGERSPGGSEALQGVSVENLTSDVAQQLKISPQTKGVVVDNVSASSKAADANLQRGDVIVQVNRRPVTNTSEFRDAVNGSSKDEPILLLVNRNGNTIFLAVS